MHIPSYAVIYRQAFPVFIASSAALFSSWTDTFLAGFWGTDAVAAVGLCSIAFFFLSSFATGFSLSVQSFTAELIGKGRQRHLLAPYCICLLLGGTLASIFMVVDLAEPERYMRTLTNDSAVIQIARRYMEPLIIALPFYYFNSASKGFLIALGMPWLASRLSLFTQAANVVLSVILAFGYLGAPRLGVFGIGLATLLAYLSGSVLYFSVVVYMICKRSLRIGSITKGNVRRIIKKTAISGSNQNLYALTLTLGFAIVGHIGAAETAIYQIINQITLLQVFISSSLGSVAISHIGRAIGDGQLNNAGAIGRKVTKAAIIPVTIYAVVMAGLSDIIVGWFLSDRAVNTGLILLFSAACLILPITVAGNLINFSLMGVQRFERVWLVSFCCQYLIFLPVGFTLGILLGFDFAGIIIAELVYRVTLLAVQYHGWTAFQKT
ncbi:MATE family efflux transporter [Flexibacterium corallicola]|uniref:MATE family efflux transporter n=1 Tax=Flexibacterium corallicola TaxID=3037259 RepID=UPI00286F4FB6|nr:MATE family efflux transporter [Pseudovibrio sp. M1P-2-3]